MAKVVYLMGVCGSGKSTVGVLLAESLGGVFLEGDDLHPPGNKAKMGAGTPLEDEDRWPWFENIRAEIDRIGDTVPLVVVACSALKRAYRDTLTEGLEEVVVVYLKGSRELIAERLSDRVHEYMPASLLDSQFSALEEPAEDEAVLIVPIEGAPADIAESVEDALRSA